jgi:hypothetical protein
MHKIKAQKRMAVEEIKTMKRKPSALFWDYRKDALWASQELINCTPHRLKDVKVLTCLKDFTLKRELQCSLFPHSHLEKYFSSFSNPGTQKLLHPWF